MCVLIVPSHPQLSNTLQFKDVPVARAKVLVLLTAHARRVAPAISTRPPAQVVCLNLRSRRFSAALVTCGAQCYGPCSGPNLCNRCNLGYFGPNCQSNCSLAFFECNTVATNVIADTCVHCASQSNCLNDNVCNACVDGYSGADCQTPCAAGYLGPACLVPCSTQSCQSKSLTFLFNADICTNCAAQVHCIGPKNCSICDDGFNGTDCSTTCVTGFHGTNCTAQCPAGTFGPSCASHCPSAAANHHFSIRCRQVWRPLQRHLHRRQQLHSLRFWLCW